MIAPAAVPATAGWLQPLLALGTPSGLRVRNGARRILGLQA